MQGSHFKELSAEIVRARLAAIAVVVKESENLQSRICLIS